MPTAPIKTTMNVENEDQEDMACFNISNRVNFSAISTPLDFTISFVNFSLSGRKNSFSKFIVLSFK